MNAPAGAQVAELFRLSYWWTDVEGASYGSEQYETYAEAVEQRNKLVADQDKFIQVDPASHGKLHIEIARYVRIEVMDRVDC